MLSRQAYRPATNSSGASEASGAIHCTSRNSLTPRVSPLATRASAKCSALIRINAAANTAIVITVVRLATVENVPR